VDVVEYLGDEQLVHFTVADRTLVAKLPVEERLAPGDDLDLAVPFDKLVLFDAETELALGR
jgi:ABC-type sugar transport system ATPase subunit